MAKFNTLRVLSVQDWAQYKKGEEYDVSPEEGHMMVGTGVAVIVEYERVKKSEPKGVMVAGPKDADK